MLSFFTTLFGQVPYQIVDTTKTWNTLSIGYIVWGVAVCGGTKTNKFQDSEVFNGKIYRKVYECEDSTKMNWQQVGLIREDTVNNRVYFSDWVSEGLLYDFNIDVGDTVFVDNYYRGFTATLVCYSIDSVYVSGELKRRYYLFSPNFSVNEIWIEGVGSLRGVLNSGLSGSGITGGDNQLLCCKKNGTIIYHNSTYNSCFIETFYPQIIQESFDTAYLNTPYMFQVLLDTRNAFSFNFIGDVIPDEFYFNSPTGFLYGTPTQLGSYGCVITVNNNTYGFLTDLIYNDIVVVLPTVNKDNTTTTEIEAYPNPFSSKINIEIEAGSNACFLQVVNISGRVMVEKTFHKGITQFKFASWDSGLYLFRFLDKNGHLIKTARIIKEQPIR